MYEDLFAAMANRRSIKRFTPKPVEMDKLLQIVQAGHLAPSSGNIQNWSFTVVTDVDIIRELYPYTLDQEPFLSAMAAIVVCGDVDHAHTMYGMRGKRLYTTQNCAAAIENMLLAATALELGCCWVGAFDEDKVCDVFGIPNEKHRPQAILLFGYPAMEPEVKELRNLDGIVFFNKFGNRVKRPHFMYFDWATEWQHQGKKLKAHAKWLTPKEKKENGERDEEPAEKSRKDKSMDELKKMSKKSGESLSNAKERLKDMFKNMKK